MGLFSRKKDIPFPSKPAEKPEPSPPDSNIDFDKLMAEIPPPPNEFQQPIAQPTMRPEQELPPVNLMQESFPPPLPQLTQQPEAQETKPELPSFEPRVKVPTCLAAGAITGNIWESNVSDKLEEDVDQVVTFNLGHQNSNSSR